MAVERPRDAARGLANDGTCCVLLPDAREEEFPIGAPFSKYLSGPLHNYFLGQSIVEDGGDWPFGEWAHGADGRRDYYRELFQTENIATIRRFLEVLAWPNQKRSLSRRAYCHASGIRPSSIWRSNIPSSRKMRYGSNPS